MKNRNVSTLAILVLLPLPLLYACDTDITRATGIQDVDRPIRGTTNLVVYPDLLALRPGESTQLGVFLEPWGDDIDPGEVEVKWGSSDPAVVSVSQTGLITAHRAGEALIYAEFGEWAGDALVAVNKDAEIPSHLRR